MTHRAPLHRMRLEILNLHEHRLREYEAKLEAVAEQMKEPKVKEKRNELFFCDGQLRSTWIMRNNEGMGLRTERYGHTLRRTKHEVF